MKTLNKPRLAISFSGGRTSAVMAKLLLDRYRETHDICVTFANTGQEHPATLDFVRDCDTHFGFGTVWLEAVVNPAHGSGVRHKVVNYETASRDGTPFRDYIAKYGIPNMGSPCCTTRLKEDVMDSYRRSIGWSVRTFDTAIGIRADEMDRMSARMHEDRFIYPLAKEGWTKAMVIEETAKWPFDLMIPGEHYGNCVWCWKKSDRKLLTIASENPQYFDFPASIEAEFSKFKVTAATKSPDGRRLFFRKHRSAADILALARAGDFTPFQDANIAPFDPELDVGGGCGESCEIGSDAAERVRPFNTRENDSTST